MAGIFVYSSQPEYAAELVGIAAAAGKEANVILLGGSAEEFKNCGAKKVYSVKAENMPESYARSISDFLKEQEAEAFLVSATSTGRDLAARVAEYSNCVMVSDAASIAFSDGGVNTTRTTYGGVIVESEHFAGFGVVTLPAGLASPVSGAAEIVDLELNADERVKRIEQKPVIKEGVDLKKAEKVLCVGMGVANRDDLKLIEDLSSKLGGAIGCTRGVAEDREWFPREQYIGISGAVVKPDLYLSFAVSGQVQHVYGIRDAKIIAAVNTDDKCPMIKNSDYAIIGDWKEIASLLLEALK